MAARAVLFDLDGTLLDTLEDLADSMNAALHREGFPPHPTDAYRYFVGEGMDQLVRRALPEGARDAAHIASGRRAMEEEYGRRWQTKTRPYPGIPALLDALQERRIPMAVLSNKPDPFTRLVVEKLLAGWTFARVQGARPDMPRKPDPAAALQMTRDLGIDPGAWLYLGDTATDMQTARAAGMRPLGATWGFRPAEELRQHGAEHLLDQPQQLLDLL